MPEWMKRITALSVVTIWIPLFGICFSEEFGYFQDTPENADQSVEQIFSSPLEPVVHISDELPGVSTFTGFINATVVDFLQTARSVNPMLFNPQRHHPQSGPKLYQLLSTYRI